MTNFSLTSSSPVSVKQENYMLDNGTLDSNNNSWCDYDIDLKLIVISMFICAPCVLGLIGNGTVIWLLGFCMKRTPITTYILNLAVADFGVLLSLIPTAARPLLESHCVDTLPNLLIAIVALLLFQLTFSVSQFLLTIISIDRCVSVLFPIWYRCHRPENLSPILCALIWIFCFLVNVICVTLDILWGFQGRRIIFYVFLVDAVVCLPLITVSSLILVIRFCFKTQQRQRGKLLKAILLALFFFLFLAFPLNLIYFQFISPDVVSFEQYYSLFVGCLGASLNSFVNPLIYFLVGRRKRCLGGENWKLTLQRVFKQEENIHGEELQLSVQTQGSV